MRIVFFVLYLFVSSRISLGQTDSLNFFLNSTENDTVKAEELMDYASRLEGEGQIKSAARVLLSCSKLTRKKNLIKFYIQSEKYRAFLLVESNNYEEAALVTGQLLSYCTENNSLIGRAACNRLYAIIEMNKGNVDVSVKKYLETQILWENTKDSARIIEGLSDLGLAFFYQKDYRSAIKYWKKTYDYYILHKQTDYAISPLNNMSASYIELQEYDEAKKILEFVLPIAIKNNDVSMLIHVYQNLAFLEGKKKNLDKSIDYTLRALKLLENSDEFTRIASLYINLGELYREKKEFKKAKENLYLGLRFAHRSKNLLKISRAYLNLSSFYADIKNFELALAYRDTSVTVNDSIFSIEKQEKVIELQEKFDSKHKEQEIESLTKDQLLKISELKKQKVLIYSFITGSILLLVLIFFIYRNFKIKKEREKKDLELLVQNAELTALKAQMNPHFIFNALNSIQHSIVVNNTEDAYRFLAKFSKLIRNILDNSSQQLIPLTTEIETITLYVDVESKRFDHSFEHRININNANELPLEKIMIPPMMLQPFIENAIWHGLMPKSGKKVLNITFNVISQENVICEISDNGIGREEAKKAAQLKNKAHKSKGISNIYERIKLLERTHAYKIEINMYDKASEANAPGGTKVIVKFEKLIA
jgi:tetratricopeptide (TPR) repeat protein